jgi:hypothetical protein
MLEKLKIGVGVAHNDVRESPLVGTSKSTFPTMCHEANIMAPSVPLFVVGDALCAIESPLGDGIWRTYAIDELKGRMLLCS